MRFGIETRPTLLVGNAATMALAEVEAVPRFFFADGAPPAKDSIGLSQQLPADQ
jgi:hypothetical protein